MIITDVSGQSIGSTFKSQDGILGILIYENWNTMSRNVGNKQKYAAQQPRRKKTLNVVQVATRTYLTEEAT
jgi:hypothetical protein